jgi:hypothetical protein
VSKKAIRLVAQVTCAVAVALVATSLGGGEAMAQKKVKSIKTEAKFVSYDAATKTIVVQVMKAGQKPSDAALKLKNGKKADFAVKPEGSVLTRTSVTLNGQRADIKDIPDGKTINIYWVPDESKPDTRFARKIDMILSDEELEARDQERMEAEKAAGRVAEGDS